MLGGFTRSLSALVHFTLHKGAAVDSVVYMPACSVCDTSLTSVTHRCPSTQKNGKDNNFQLVSHWVFSMLKYITKVKLLFLYRFSVLSVHLHYKPLSRDGGRVRPHFYVLG